MHAVCSRASRSFFTFWQSIAIAVLNHFDVLTTFGSWSQHQVSVGLQDFAVCLEMFLLAIVHIFAFEFQSYQDAMAVRLVFFDSLRFFGDAKAHLTVFAQMQPESSDNLRFVPWQTWKPVMRNFASTISQRDMMTHVGAIMSRQASQHARKQQEALFSGSEDHVVGGDAEERKPLLSELADDSPHFKTSPGK